MTVWQAMHKLEQLGYSFVLTDEGKIQARIVGVKPAEASALLDIARADKESAAAYVRQRLSGAFIMTVEREYSLCETLAAGLALQAGEGQLFGPIRLCQGKIFFTWGGGALAPWIEKVKAWVRQEMAIMDNAEYWELSPEDFTTMCCKYAMLAERARCEFLVDCKID